MFTPGSSALEAWQTNKVEPCLLLQASGWTMAGCPGSHVSECATVVAVAGVPGVDSPRLSVSRSSSQVSYHGCRKVR